MFTYVPYGGTVWSPFGFGYFSPYSVLSYYAPGRYNWNGGGTARNGVVTRVPLTASGTSGVVASQIARYGSGMNSHPTLSMPVRPTESMSSAPGGFRGGMGDFGGAAGMGGFGSPNAGGGRFGGGGQAAPAMSAP